MFKFKLQVPLEARKRAEDKKRVEYAEALGKVGKERDELGGLVDKYRDTSDSYITLQQEGVDMEIIKLFRPYFGRLKVEQRLKGASIQGKLKEAEEKRGLLTEAMKKRRVLENLREKKYLEYVRESDRKEQMAGDESAVNFYLRRKNED